MPSLVVCFLLKQTFAFMKLQYCGAFDPQEAPPRTGPLSVQLFLHSSRVIDSHPSNRPHYAYCALIIVVFCYEYGFAYDTLQCVAKRRCAHCAVMMLWCGDCNKVACHVDVNSVNLSREKPQRREDWIFLSPAALTVWRRRRGPWLRDEGLTPAAAAIAPSRRGRRRLCSVSENSILCVRVNSVGPVANWSRSHAIFALHIRQNKVRKRRVIDVAESTFVSSFCQTVFIIIIIIYLLNDKSTKCRQ